MKPNIVIDPPRNHLTPLEIGMCAHYAGSCEDYPRQGAPAIAKFMLSMRRYGLLTETNEKERSEGWGLYKSTAKLRTFVKLMGETPLPEPAWIDPRTQRRIE